MMVSYFKGEEKDRVDIDPKVIGINRELRAISFPKEFEGLKNRDSLATYVAELGQSALSGKEGMFYDGLVYSASLILWHIGEEKTLLSASEKVRATLDSSNVLDRINNK
jgi:anthranilate phosphoribosyltransferase